MNYLFSSPHLGFVDFVATDPTALLFLSAYRKVRTSGVVEHISVPAIGGSCKDSPIQNAIAAAFDTARKLGQKNPIAIGAIPFDVSQPSCLTIPEWYECLPHVSVNTEAGLNSEYLTASKYSYQPEKPAFKKMIRNAVDKLKQGRLNKVVLSRMLALEFKQDIDCNMVLNRLINQNPGVFQFRIPLGDNNTLIGASPELLVRKENNTFYSNPLAGTWKRDQNQVQDSLNGQQLLSSEKNQLEHRLVVKTVKAQLRSLCDTLQIPKQPSLSQTSNLWHLSTRIQGTLKEPSTNALQIACLLHPTPALCGAPTRLAKKMIDELEPYDRGLFGGFIGWCDSKGNGEWAVAIRCGIVQPKRIRLFAGAGIVADSDPESEWQETGAKLATMLNAFNICNKGNADVSMKLNRPLPATQ